MTFILLFLEELISIDCDFKNQKLIDRRAIGMQTADLRKRRILGSIEVPSGSGHPEHRVAPRVFPRRGTASGVDLGTRGSKCGEKEVGRVPAGGEFQRGNEPYSAGERSLVFGLEIVH